MKIERIDLKLDNDAEKATIEKVNAAMKIYGGYIDGYLQLVEVESLGYMFQIVRDEAAVEKVRRKK